MVAYCCCLKVDFPKIIIPRNRCKQPVRTTRYEQPVVNKFNILEDVFFPVSQYLSIFKQN